MKLWLIEQDVNGGYDTYDGAVVVAPDAETAAKIHPGGDKWGQSYPTWAFDPEQVKVTLIGEAAPDLESGHIVCASFNAG